MITLAMVAALALPPSSYDHKPSHAYRVEYVPASVLEAYCPRRPWEVLVVGCTVLDRYVLLHEDLTPQAAAHVLRHELGHVNGWKHR